jgi:TatD DNase family protein
VIHCFTGNYDAARAYLIWDSIFRLPALSPSRTPMLCAKWCGKFRWNACSSKPIRPTHPVPHRGKRNEPAYVRFVGETVGKVKQLDLEKVAQVTTENVKSLFHI